MASIFDSPGVLNALMAAQSQGLFDDVNPTGVAPMQRSGSGILETGEYTGDPELPGATWMDVVGNINQRHTESNTQIRENMGAGVGVANFLGTNMSYSPEMAARMRAEGQDIREDNKVDFGLGDAFYDSGMAQDDILSELARHDITGADGLVQGVKGSHNDLYPNLGPVGNPLYLDELNPRGGRSRDVEIDPTMAANAPIGAYIGREKGQQNLFDSPIWNAMGTLLAPATGGLSAVAVLGARAASGETLHGEDYWDTAKTVIGANLPTDVPTVPGVEVDPTIYNLVAQSPEMEQKVAMLDSIIEGAFIAKQGYDIFDDIREYEKELGKETEIGQVGDITGPGGAYDITVLDYPNAPEQPPESTEGGGGGGSTSATTEQGGASAPSEGGLEPIGEIPDPIAQPTHDWPSAEYEFENDDDYTVTPTTGGNVLIVTHKDTGSVRQVGAGGRDMRDSTDEVVEEEEETFTPPTTNLPDGYRWEEGEDGEPVLVNESEEEDDFDLSVEGSMQDSGLSVGGVTGDLADMHIEDMTLEQIAKSVGSSGAGTTGDGVNGDGDNGTGEGDGGDGTGEGDGTLLETSGQIQESQLKELDDLFPYLNLTPSEYAKLRDNPDLVAALLGDRA